MAEGGSRRQDAEIVREADRGPAVPVDHFPDLIYALRAMHRIRHTSFLGRIEAVAQQIRRAGVDLRRGDDPGQPSAWVSPGFPDQPQRRVEAATTGGLVPAVFQLPAIVHVPARGGIARCQKDAHSPARREVDPAVVGAGDVHHAGDAGQHHLAERHLLAGHARLGVGAQGDGAFVQARHVLRGQPVLLAHAAEKRLGAGMRMQIDQPRHHHEIAAVDGDIGGAVIVLSNEDDRFVREHHVAVCQIDMPPVRAIPGDDAGGVGDAGGDGHGGSSDDRGWECG